MHSWRVLLLPFLDQKPLFDQYRFDEPWDGPHNRKLVSQIQYAYRCPSHGHHGNAGCHALTAKRGEHVGWIRTLNMVTRLSA